MKALFLTPILAVALAGCMTVAKTAVEVVTLPVKVVAAGVDAATTSQSEADEKRGRELRKAEEGNGKRLRDWEKRCTALQRDEQPCPPLPEFIVPD